MLGAMSGLPGALPSNWALIDLMDGISQRVVGIATEDGIDYIDIRFCGVSPGGTFRVVFDTRAIEAVKGEIWTLSAFIKNLGPKDGTGGGAQFFLGAHAIACYAPVGNQRCEIFPGTSGARLSQCRSSYTYRVAETCDHIQPYLALDVVGGAIDVTLRIGWPQAENAQRASSPVRTIGTALSYKPDIVMLHSPLLDALRSTATTVIIEVEGASPTGWGNVLTDSNGAALFMCGNALMSASRDVITVSDLTDLAMRHILGLASDTNGRLVTASTLGTLLTSKTPRGSGTHYLGSDNGENAINGRIRRIRVACRKMAASELRAACGYRSRPLIGAVLR